MVQRFKHTLFDIKQRFVSPFLQFRLSPNSTVADDESCYAFRWHHLGQDLVLIS